MGPGTSPQGPREGRRRNSGVDASRASLWTSQTPEDLLELAKKQAAQANLIGSGNTPISAPAQAVRKLDDDYAVAILRGALARGFKDLESDEDQP